MQSVDGGLRDGERSWLGQWLASVLGKVTHAIDGVVPVRAHLATKAAC